jgi:hypothetical protein
LDAQPKPKEQGVHTNLKIVQRQFKEDLSAGKSPEENSTPDGVQNFDTKMYQQKNSIPNETFFKHLKRGSEDSRKIIGAESGNNSWHHVTGGCSTIKDSIDLSHNHTDKPEFLDDIWGNSFRNVASTPGKSKHYNARELLIQKQKSQIQKHHCQITDISKELLLHQQHNFLMNLHESDQASYGRM